MQEETYISGVQKKLIIIEAARKEIIRGLWIFLLVSFVFLSLRIILRAFGASPMSLFAGFIYLVSSIFLLPFFGIFSQSNVAIIPGDAMFDGTAVFAIFSYLVLVLLIVAVIQI